MATVRTWVAGTDTDPTTDANWDPAGPVVDDDTLIFNDEATQLCDGNDYSHETEVGVSIIVEESFPFTVGSSGTPLQFNGFNYFSFKGGGTGTSYFTAGGAGYGGAGDDDGFDNAVVDSPSPATTAVALFGAITRLTNERGRTAITAGAALTGRLQIMPGAGNAPSEVTIPSGCTLTGSYIAVEGGLLMLSTTGIEIKQTDGEIVLSGTAGVSTRLEKSGGDFFWDAKSTIALAECSGGTFTTRFNRISRTLAASAFYGDAVADLRIGGLNLVYTKNPLVYGNAQLRRPSGVTVTATGVSTSFPV